MKTVHKTIAAYNRAQKGEDGILCSLLKREIERGPPDATGKIWHGHPVWLLDGNPIAGYSKLKDGIRLMFWSGASFGEQQLKAGTGKFKDASIRYASAQDLRTKDLQRWLKKSRRIQWDYKNIVKRRGVLKRIKQSK